MRVMLWTALCILLVVCCVLSPGVEGRECLDSSVGVTVCWSHVGGKAHFLLQAPSEGWVGLGIPDGGGMAGADIAVVETAPDGNRVVNDYYSLQPNGPPLPDACQDWELISFNITDGKISAEIARLLVTPDQQDRPIDLNSTMDFIIAHGSTPTVSYHSTARGTIRIPFTGQNASSAQHFEGDPDVVAYDLRVDGYAVPKDGEDGKGTTYADFCFDLSGLDEMQIVGFEQIIPPEVQGLVHHAGVNGYETNTACNENSPDGAGPDPAPMIYLWAGHPHNTAFKLPDDAGIPVGGGKAAMDAVLQGGPSPEEKAHVLTLDSAEDVTRLGTSLMGFVTGFEVNDTNAVVGPQENCSTDVWNDACNKQELLHCFGTCWGSWVGECGYCGEYLTQGYLFCLPCYGKESSLAVEKEMLMTCDLATLTLKDGEGRWQGKVESYGWHNLYSSPLNGGESWQRIKYPVEVYCVRSTTPTVRVITVQNTTDLQSRWDAGELEAVVGCQTGKGGECFSTGIEVDGKGFGYNLLERSGETTWPPSWMNTVQYPLSLTVSNPIYRAAPKLRQLTRYQSLQLNIHYDNRLRVADLVDNSSILRLFLAKTPRKHEAAVLIVGDPVLSGPDGHSAILPGLSRDVFQCPEFGCRGLWGNTEEVTIFSSLLHMHEAGRMMTVDVRRGENEVVHSDKLDYYDFNWQGQRKHQPWTLKRGDRAQVDCVYEVGAGREVRYGQASSQEMCVWLLGYYPRIRDTPGVGTAARCGAGSGGQWQGFCGSEYTNASTRYLLESIADLDSPDKAMGTPRTFGIANRTCDAPTKGPLPPNSPTQSPLPSSVPPSTNGTTYPQVYPSVKTPSATPQGQETGPPSQSPSTADELRSTGLATGSSGDDDSSAWWVVVVILVPVLIAAGGISVWVFSRYRASDDEGQEEERPKEVEFTLLGSNTVSKDLPALWL